MAKMTKTQTKRMLLSIRDKSFKLLGKGIFSTTDFDKISGIVQKGIRKNN